MGILDTFYILFKSDAEDVEKGAIKAKSATDNLEHSIGGADKTTVFLGKKFNSLATKAVAAFASVFAVTNLISRARGIAVQSTGLGVLSEELGESASELVNWSRAVEQAGGTPKGFLASMQGLSGSINDAFVNAINAATIELGRMDISARDTHDNMRTVLDILPELAKKFSTLKREAALPRGKALGLDTATILFLMRGEGAVAALVDRQRDLNTVSDEQIAKARRVGAAWNRVGNQLSDVKTEVFSLAVGLTEIETGAIRARMRGETPPIREGFFKDLISNSVELFQKGAEGLGKFFSTEPVKMPEPLSDKVSAINFEGLKGEIAAMAATPLSAIGAQAAAGSVSNRSSSVTVGEVNIVTPATDPAAIASEISNELESQLSNAVEQNDNGILA